MLFTSLSSYLIFTSTTRYRSSFYSKYLDSAPRFRTILFSKLLLRIFQGLVLELKDLVCDRVDSGVEHSSCGSVDHLKLLDGLAFANNLVVAVDVLKGRLELRVVSIIFVFEDGSEHGLINKQHQFIECYHYMNANRKSTLASWMLGLALSSVLLMLLYLTLVVVSKTDIKLPSHHFQVKFLQAQKSLWSMSIVSVNNAVASDNLIFLSMRLGPRSIKLTMGKQCIEPQTSYQQQQQRNYSVRVYYLPFQIQIMQRDKVFLKFDFTESRFKSSFQELHIHHFSQGIFSIPKNPQYVFDNPLPTVLFRSHEEEHLLTVHSSCPSLFAQHQPLKLLHFCLLQFTIELTLNYKVLEKEVNGSLVFIKNRTLQLHQQLANISNNSVIQQFLQMSKFIEPASLWLDSSIYDSSKVQLDQNRFLLKDLAQFLSHKMLVIQLPSAVVVSDDSYFYLQLDKNGLFLNTEQIVENGDLVLKPSRKAERPFEIEGRTPQGQTCKFIDFLKHGTAKAYKHFLKKLFLKLKFQGVFLYDNNKFYTKNAPESQPSELKLYFSEVQKDEGGNFVSLSAVHNYSRSFTQLTHHIRNAQLQLEVVNQFFRQNKINPLISSKQSTSRPDLSPFRKVKVRGSWVEILEQTVIELKQNSLHYFWGLTLEICQNQESCQLELQICLIYPACLFKGIFPQRLKSKVRDLLILKRKLKHSLIIYPFYSIFSRELQNELLRVVPNCMGQLILVKTQRICIIIKPGNIACHGVIGIRYELLISFIQDEHYNYVAKGQMLSAIGSVIKITARIDVKLSRNPEKSHYRISLMFECSQFEDTFPLVERVRLHLYEQEQYESKLQFRIQDGLIFKYSVYLKDTIREQ